MSASMHILTNSKVLYLLGFSSLFLLPPSFSTANCVDNPSFTPTLFLFLPQPAIFFAATFILNNKLCGQPFLHTCTLPLSSTTCYPMLRCCQASHATPLVMSKLIALGISDSDRFFPLPLLSGQPFSIFRWSAKNPFRPRWCNDRDICRCPVKGTGHCHNIKLIS